VGVACGVFGAYPRRVFVLLMGDKMNHEHIDLAGINCIPRDISLLVATAKEGKLSTKEQVEIGYALEMWHTMAIKCEAAIHRITKGDY
jgi:hypothetical protein